MELLIYDENNNKVKDVVNIKMLDMSKYPTISYVLNGDTTIVSFNMHEGERYTINNINLNGDIYYPNTNESD